MSYSSATCNNATIAAFSESIITGQYWHRNVIVINPGSNLPYNITVACPDGYSVSGITGNCIQKPGNGFRTGNETCDDNNTADGDG